MKAAAALGLGVLAAGVGVGGTLAVQELTSLPEASGDGLAVICDRHFTKCWQSGDEVRPPRGGDRCSRADLPLGYWSSHMAVAGGTARQGFVYFCFGEAS